MNQPSPDGRADTRSGGLVRIARIVETIERIGAEIAGFAIFAVMIIVFLDVFFRYLFRAPFAWSYDLVSLYLGPALFCLVLSETFRENHHVAVDIFYLRFSPTMKRLARLVIAILMAVVVFEVIVLAFEEAERGYRNNEVLSGAILWPTWIPLGFVVLGFGVLLLRLVLDATALITAMLMKSAGTPGESPARSAAHSHEGDTP